MLKHRIIVLKNKYNCFKYFIIVRNEMKLLHKCSKNFTKDF